jgi:hypothetical protein
MRTKLTQGEEFGVGAQVFGLLSLGLCWWFPFGPLLGAFGTGLGIASLMAGVGRRRFVGTAFAISGLAIGLLLASNDWTRLLGG